MNGLEKVFLAIDVANLWNACRIRYGKQARIDFEVLKNIYPTFVGGLDKVELYYPSAYIVTHKRQTHGSFTEVLMALGYYVKETRIDYAIMDSKPIAVHDDWTVGISIDALNDVDHYDTFVLVTGKGQYKHLIQELKQKGKKVVILTFETPETNKLFKELADEVLFLSKDIIYK